MKENLFCQPGAAAFGAQHQLPLQRVGYSLTFVLLQIVNIIFIFWTKGVGRFRYV